MVNASPAQLDTLNELAAALGNDANFSATITAAIAAKIPVAEKGVANGVATLDATGKVPLEQLPEGTGTGTGSSTPGIAALTVVNSTATLTFDADQLLYGGTLSSFITLAVAATGNVGGVVKIISFTANGTHSLNIPAGWKNENGSQFVNVNGQLNELWVRSAITPVGAIEIRYLWAQ